MGSEEDQALTSPAIFIPCISILFSFRQRVVPVQITPESNPAQLFETEKLGTNRQSSARLVPSPSDSLLRYATNMPLTISSL